ncbi:MAG: phosphotransferase family protein [Myxococcota bacterium]
MGEQDVGDLEVVRRGVEAWLRERLPDGRGLRIADLAFPKASGESSVTLLLDGEHADGRVERFVLRMAPRASQVFETHDLRLQVEMMDIARAEGVPVPDVVGYEPDARRLGSDFYVMRFTEGEIPPDNPPMVFAGWVKELGAAERERMWRSGLETLAAIHRIDPAKHDVARLPRAGAGESVVAHELRKFDSMFRPDLRASGDPRILEAWRFALAHAPGPGPVRVCWGDSRVGNIVWRELAPVAVLDWEMASLSCPLLDLAWWIWIDRCNSVGLGAGKLAGVPEPGEAYAQWHALTGLPIDDVAYYELLAVVRYAIVLELKFVAMRAGDAAAAALPNFAAAFLPGLVEACAR